MDDEDYKEIAKIIWGSRYITKDKWILSPNKVSKLLANYFGKDNDILKSAGLKKSLFNEKKFLKKCGYIKDKKAGDL